MPMLIGFNPRPRVEGDLHGIVVGTGNTAVSIHVLAWGGPELIEIIDQ